MDIYTLECVKQIVGSSGIAQGVQLGTLLSLRGRVGWWAGGSRGRGYMYTYS